MEDVSVKEPIKNAMYEVIKEEKIGGAMDLAFDRIDATLVQTILRN